MRKPFLSGLVLVAAVSLGCAGDEFTRGSAASGAGAAGSSAGSGGAGGALTGSASSGSGTGGAAGAVASSSADSSSSAASAASSGSGGSPPFVVTLHCHNDLCMAGNVCCHDGDGPAGDQCESPGNCLDAFAEAACAGPADCPANQVCCMDLGGINNFLVVHCVDQCEQGPNHILMCEGDPTVCNGNPCNDSTWLGDGYHWCQTP